MYNQDKNLKYIIIGAGIAGLTAIKGIREIDNSGSILLLSNENRLPYKRTKINKHITVGFKTNDFSINEPNWYKEQGVEIIYDDITSIKLELKQVESKNNCFTYDKLLLAIGAQPKITKTKGLADIPYHFVHFASEVERIIKQAKDKKHYLIIGGGIEGLETADQLLALNKKVTVVQRSTNPLKSLFPKYITNKIYQTIKNSGINYLDGEEVLSIQNKGGGNYQAITNNHIINCDEVIVCAGSKANIDRIKQSGLNVNNGIIVNEYLQTSNQDIYAAGDVAEHPNGLVTGLWHPAEYQGLTAGKNMAGKNEIYYEVPYRLKSEFLGKFLFSANYYKVTNKTTQPIIESNDNIYRELFIENNKLYALVMMNDKNRAKKYQKAIAENWSAKKLQEEIPL